MNDKKSIPIGTNAKLLCNPGFVVYPNSTEMAKEISIYCSFDQESLETELITSEGLPLPDCQKGCVTNQDCQTPTPVCHEGIFVNTNFIISIIKLHLGSIKRSVNLVNFHIL